MYLVDGLIIKGYIYNNLFNLWFYSFFFLPFQRAILRLYKTVWTTETEQKYFFIKNIKTFCQ